MTKTFTPENDEDTLYILANYSNYPISEILEMAEAHFNMRAEDLNIQADYIQTRCIGYDLYDPSDYDRYIVITK